MSVVAGGASYVWCEACYTSFAAGKRSVRAVRHAMQWIRQATRSAQLTQQASSFTSCNAVSQADACVMRFGLELTMYDSPHLRRQPPHLRRKPPS